MQETGRRPGGETDHLRTLWRGLRRNPWLVLGVPALVFTATVAFVATATPVYQTSTAIRIDESKSNIALLDALQTLSAGGSKVNTEMEVLRSRSLAGEVVDTLALRFRLERPTRTPRGAVLGQLQAPDTTPAADFLLTRRDDGRFDVEVRYRDTAVDDPFPFLRESTTRSLGVVAPGNRVEFRGASFVVGPAAAEHEAVRVRLLTRDDAIRKLRDRVTIGRPNRDADIILVAHEGTDRRLVRDVAAAYADLFITRRQSVLKTEAHSTAGFVREQIDSLGRQLAAAEAALQTFREGNRVVSLEAEGQAQIKRLAEMQAQRDLAAAEHAALARLLTDVEATAAAEPDRASPYRRLLAFPTLFRNPAAADMLAMLVGVEGERAHLINRRTDADPDVAVLTGRIQQIEEQLRSIATTYAEGLSNQVGSLETRLAGVVSQLEDVPAKEVAFARLQREAEILSDIFKLLQMRLKEAEIAAAVEDVSVRVVDPAALPSRPVKPQVPLSLALALLLGTFAGAAMAVAREQLDTRIRTREELQTTSGLALLGVIPELAPAAANGRFRRGRGGGGGGEGGGGGGGGGAESGSYPRART
jgi:uncharacterized protein involved in exopolysaccharide biosynthesis